MKIELYHEIDPSSKDSVLEQGIKRRSEGEKTDSQKKKVDIFLDTHLPDWAKEKGLSRQDAIYAYLSDGEKVVDITDGEAVSVDIFKAKSDQVLLRLSVESEHCYVSDLNLYDTLVRAMELDEQDSTREHLADRYWERIIPLEEYESGTIKRPEVMVIEDISPRDISVIKSK